MSSLPPLHPRVEWRIWKQFPLDLSDICDVYLGASGVLVDARMSADSLTLRVPCPIEAELGSLLFAEFTGKKRTHSVAIALFIQLCECVLKFHKMAKTLHGQVSPKAFLFVDSHLMNGSAHWELLPSTIRLDAKTMKMQCAVGVPDHVSPEVLAGTHFGFEMDVWSLGVMLYEMRWGWVPFFGRDAPSVFENILSYSYEFDQDDHDPFIEKILERIFCPVEKRIALEALIPWCKKLCDKAVVLLLCVRRFPRKTGGCFEWLPRDLILLICKEYLIPHRLSWIQNKQ